MTRVAVVASVMLLVSAASTSAQAPEVLARVIRTAVLVEEPRGDSVVITTIPPGVVVQILAQDRDWLEVPVPDDVAGALQATGWLNRAAIELLPSSGAIDTVPAAQAQPPSVPVPQIGSAVQYPRTEATVAWALLSDSTLSDASDVSELLGGPSIDSFTTLGFAVSVTGNANHWFGVTVEGGGSFYNQDIVGFDLFRYNLLTLVAGPKFTVRQLGQAHPFVHVLFGGVYRSAEIPPADLSGSDWSMAIQPGGGVDIYLSDSVGLRFGIDGRFIGNDNPFGTDTESQFRITAGITFN